MSADNKRCVVIPGQINPDGSITHFIGSGDTSIARENWTGISHTNPNFKNPDKWNPEYKAMLANLDILVQKLIEFHNNKSSHRVYIGYVGSKTTPTGPDADPLERKTCGTNDTSKKRPPAPSADVMHVYGANENNWLVNEDVDLSTLGSGQVEYFSKGRGRFGVVSMPVADISKIDVEAIFPVGHTNPIDLPPPAKTAGGGFIKSRKIRFEKRKNKTRKIHRS